MANRPIFAPKSHEIGVKQMDVDFIWSPGMAISQKQKSITSLHESGKRLGLNRLLEISSKSKIDLGKKLSAFNLFITTRKYKFRFSVECAYQSSKVFENGGPYTDLLEKTSREAKKDPRIQNSGRLINFKFFNDTFPLIPRTYFYDWIYINALHQNTELANEVLDYDGFTDIEFNPQKMLNCQAYAAAIYVSLYKQNCLEEALTSHDNFYQLLKSEYTFRDKARMFKPTII